jgi:hypothetical protein
MLISSTQEMTITTQDDLVIAIDQYLRSFLQSKDAYASTCDYVLEQQRIYGKQGYLMLDLAHVLPMECLPFIEETCAKKQMHGVWMTEEDTYEWMIEEHATHLWDKEVAPLLGKCDERDFIAIATATLDRGNVAQKRYLTAFRSVVLKTVKRPSKISVAQIEKRLKRLVSNGITMVELNTSHPDCMGENLHKWLAAVMKLQQRGKNLVVVVSDTATPG